MNKHSELDYQITNECNFFCQHCSMNSFDKIENEMEYDQIISVLKIIYNRLNRNKISISGGEPFLKKNLFKIIDVIQNIGFQVRIQTNAYLVNYNILDYLKDHNIELGLSIDGYNDVSLRQNMEEYSNVIRVLDYCQKKSIPVKVCTTVYKNNIKSIPELCLYLNQKQVVVHSIFPITPMGRATKYKNELPTALDWELLLLNIKKILSDSDQLFTTYLVSEPFSKNKKIIKLCDDIESSPLFLTADGKLFPCIMLKDSIFNIDLDKVASFKMPEFDINSASCKNKELVLNCKGGCPAYRIIFDDIEKCDRRCQYMFGYLPGCTRKYSVLEL